MRKSLLNNQPELRSREMQKTMRQNAMTKILMALFAILLIPQGLWAQTYYGLFIGHYELSSIGSGGQQQFTTVAKGVRVSSTNYSNITDNCIQGKVSYNHDTHTLTLENATINGCIYSYGDLAIELKGTNTIIAPDTSAIVNDMAGTTAQNLTFKSSDGTGSLIITSYGNPCVRNFNINYGTGVSLRQGSLEFTSHAALVGTPLFSGGDGSTNSPYLISSPTDLKNLAKYVNSGLLPTAGKNFKLTQHINGSELGSFEPIAYSTIDFPNAPDFEGTFDGGGKKIYNIIYDPNVITSTNQNPNGIALFGVCHGTVKNLTLENCTFGGGYCNGAIAEFFEGTLENCTVSSCTIESNGQNGGLAGYVWTNTIIKNCSVINCTIKDGGAMGGIAAYPEAGVSIQNCTVDGGAITTTSSGEFGGIAANGDADISNCIVKGISITCGDGSNAAAIVPYAYGTLVGNYYYADVTVTIGGTTLSGYTQRGTKTYDNQQNLVHSDVFVDDGIVLYTKQLTFSHGGYSDVVANAYYKQSSTNLVSVAPGQPVQLTVTPLGSHLPKDATVTYTPTGGAEQTIKPTKAADSYVYTFTMPDANATFTLDYAINLGHDSFTCLYNNTTNYSTDFTALAVVLPTTITMDDGKTITPLTQGTDYTIEGYKDWQKQALNSTPVNAGTYYVTIKGKDNYTGTTDVQFTISRIDLKNVTVASISNQTYTGSPIEPAITATLNGVVINANEYGVAYTNNTNVTTANAPATVTLSANGYSFTGGSTKTATFKIVAKALTDAMVTLSATTFTYNGSAQKPTVTVKDGNKTLTENTDYTLTNAGGTAVGTYDVVVKGKGNYAGTITKQFTISANAGALTVTPATTSYTYDGTEKKPAVTVKSGTTTLTVNTDYTVAYTDNINAGTATVTATGKGNYAGATGSATFTINAKALTDAMVTLSATTFVYNGSVQKPTVTVKDGNKTLTQNTDYTITNAGGTAVGTYNVVVKGKGNYSGTITKQFTISANAGALTVTPTTTSYTYDGTEKEPAVTVKSGTTTLTANTDYTVVYSNNTNVGTATVTVTGKDNYAGATGSATFTINAKALTDAMVTLSATTFSYSGSLQKPTVTVKDGNKTLTQNTDYTLTNAGGTAVGTYNVIVKGKGNYSGTITKQFTISADASALTVTPATTSYTYDGTEKKPAVTVKSGTATLTANTDYTVAYTDNINAGTATITVTGKGNFAGATGTATFTINKAAGSISYATTNINKTEGDAAFTNDLTYSGDGTVTFASKDETVATVNASGVVTILKAGTTTITATVADGMNYTYATKTTTYTLNVASAIKKYDLWIGSTQVTEENLSNILGDAGNTFLFVPSVNTLFITNSTSGQKIESKMVEGLKIYLAPSSENKLDGIVSTVAAPLTITTDGNYPGRLELEAAYSNVIDGFSVLNLEENLAILDTENIEYRNNALEARKATIGIVIEPIVQEETESFDHPELNDNSLENYVYDSKVLITLNDTENPDGDGFDDSGTPGIVLNNVVTDDTFNLLDMDDSAPGTQKFADIFTGLTILVPGGEGWIVIDAETHDGYCIKLRSLFGEDLEAKMTTNGVRTKQAFHYEFDEPTFVGIYNGGLLENAARGKVIRPGKKTVTHIKVFNATVSPGKVNASNPAGAASGGLYTGPVPAVGQDVDNPTEIESGIDSATLNDKGQRMNDKWYNLNGQQINEPSMKGLYIRNGKKTYIK